MARRLPDTRDPDEESDRYSYWPRDFDGLEGDYYWDEYVVEILRHEAEEDPYARELRYLRLNAGAEGKLPCPSCGGSLLPGYVWPRTCPCKGRGFVFGIGGRKVACPSIHRLRIEQVPPHPVPATCKFCVENEGD